jgi:hypothetical protein
LQCHEAHFMVLNQSRNGSTAASITQLPAIQHLKYFLYPNLESRDHRPLASTIDMDSSRHNFASSCPSNSFFSRDSAFMERPEANTQADLVKYLSVVQKCNIDFLPMRWLPALGALGEGGTGAVNQSDASLVIAFAFKRLHGYRDLEDFFLPLLTEILVLSQPLIKEHPNVLNLEGVY